MQDNRQKHDYLLKVIPKGKEHAIQRRQLASMLNVNRREVSRLVMTARLDEIIIALGGNGYYQPVTDDELREYHRTARKRAITILATLKAARREMTRRGLTPVGARTLRRKGNYTETAKNAGKL